LRSDDTRSSPCPGFSTVGTPCPLFIYRETFVYYEVINLELNRKLICECRCDERLEVKVERSTRLIYTGLRGGLEHLKIETRLIDERFESVMSEYVI
jgi:hypothetical protein